MLKTLNVADFFVDGKTTTPAWWTLQKGAYGCMLGHRAAIAHAVANRVYDVLILEEDAESTGHGEPDELYNEWLGRTPNLDIFYCGGQYLDVINNPPRIVGVIPPHIILSGGMLIRLHAYICTWTGMQKCLALIDETLQLKTSIPVDDLFGKAILSGRLNGYGIAPWLFGQSGHDSQVREGKYAPPNDWPLSLADWRLIVK